MNTILGMIVIGVLTVLYGLAWHDQPAREPARARTTHQLPDRHE